MKVVISNYVFSHVAKTLTLPDYSAVGLILANFYMIVDVANNDILYNFIDPTKGGSVSGNVLTLDFNTNMSAFSDSDPITIIYDDPNASQNVNPLGLTPSDKVTNYIAGNADTPLTSSGVASPIPCVLRSLFVSSLTSSPTVEIWDNATTNQGTKKLAAFVPVLGKNDLCDIQMTLGAYVVISGTISLQVMTLATLT